MDKSISYKEYKFDFEENLVFRITKEKVKIYRVANKSDFSAL